MIERPEASIPTYLLTVPWSLDGIGGVNEVVLNLAHQIQKSGIYQPMIAVVSWGPKVERPPCRGIRVTSLNIPEPENLSGLLKSALLLPSTLLQLARFVRRYRISVVNVHFPGLYAAAFLMLRRIGLFGGRLILSFHGSDVAGIHGLGGWRRAAYATLLRHADALVACSEALRSNITSIVPQLKNLTTIYNGIDASLFRKQHRRRDRRRILHVGKFDQKKSQDVLLHAFKLLLNSRPDALLTLVGSRGTTLEETNLLISQLGIRDSVEIFVDVPHEQMPGFFERSDLFVLPSRSESFPLVLLEAGAAGLPVIAANVGGIPEMIEPGVTGILVPSEGIFELGDAIRDLLNNPDAADRLAENWHRKVLSSWSWGKLWQQYLQVIASPSVISRPAADFPHPE